MPPTPSGRSMSPADDGADYQVERFGNVPA